MPDKIRSHHPADVAARLALGDITGRIGYVLLYRLLAAAVTHALPGPMSITGLALAFG